MARNKEKIFVEEVRRYGHSRKLVKLLVKDYVRALYSNIFERFLVLVLQYIIRNNFLRCYVCVFIFLTKSFYQQYWKVRGDFECIILFRVGVKK